MCFDQNEICKKNKIQTLFLFTWPSSCVFALPKSKIIDMPVVSQHFKPCFSLSEPIGSMNCVFTVR